MRRDRISPELRERVLKRDGYACRYCGSMDGPFHMDHVYPYSKGGETTYENLVTACSHCNIKKHNRVGVWPWPIQISYPEQKTKKVLSPDTAIVNKLGALLLLIGATLSPTWFASVRASSWVFTFLAIMSALCISTGLLFLRARFYEN